MQQVSELMTREVAVVAPDDSMQRAAQRMAELNVGALPVCQGKRLQGMVTDRDIAVRGVAAGHVPAQARVADVMSPQAKSVREEASLQSAAQLMSELQVRRLPVVNGEGDLVGILSLGDLALHDLPRADTALRDISSPTPPAT